MKSRYAWVFRLLPALAAFMLAALVAFVFFGNRAGKERELVILYTTDAHGRVISDENTIGLDKIAAVKKSLPHSLLLDAGDFLHGNSLANFEQGQGVVRLMKSAGYFAAAAGNHEFSHGLEALRGAQQLASEPPAMHLLSANARLAAGSLLLEPHAQVELNGVRVCVFGLTTPETATQASPDAVAGLFFEDPLQAAGREVEALRNQGCDLVIALAHLGSGAKKEHNSIDLALRVQGLDALIDGHSHVMLDGRLDNGVWVVSSGEHGKRLGRLDLVYDTESRKIASARNRLLAPEDLAGITPDPELAAALADLRAQSESLRADIVARSPIKLSGKKAVLRTRESGLGDLCADAMRLAARADRLGGNQEPAIAIVNAGNIRAPLKKGPVSRGDILDMLPFGGRVLAVRVSGVELLEILEHGFSALPDADGRFPQLSGLRVRVNPQNPPGRRVLAVELPVSPCLDFEPLNPSASYLLFVNEFMAAGGDGYPHLAGKERLFEFGELADLVINFMRERDLSVYDDDRQVRILFRGAPDA